MASQQVLSLVVSAIDKASKVLGSVSGAVKGLGGSADQAAAKQDNLGNIITASMVKAQVAINGVQAAYGKLTGAIQEASNIELENLNAASGLEGFVGDYDKAAKMVSSISKDLAKAAGPLPGSTGEYVSIFRNITDDIGNAFKGSDGRIADLAAYEKTLKSLSISFGAINATGDKNLGNMQLGLTRILSGASLKEVFAINSFGNNPRLRAALEEAVKKSGKDLQNMTAAERVKMLEQVGSSLITPEYLARAQNTLDATWQSFISGLFDGQGGLFGVMRDLDEQMEGDQTVYESAKATVAALIGNDGMFAKIGGILSEMGLTTDPMVQLKSGIDRLNGFLGYVNRFLGGIKTALGEGYSNFGELVLSKLRMVRSDILDFFGRMFGFDPASLGEIGETLGFNLSRGLNNIAQRLGQIDYGAVLSQAGVWAARGVNVMLQSLFGFLAGADWGQVATVALNMMGGLMRGVFSFLMNLDWGIYATAAGAAIISFVIPGLVGVAGAVVAAIGAGIAGLPVLLIAAVTLAVIGLAKLAWDFRDKIAEGIAFVVNGISGVWSMITNAASQAASTVVAKVSEFFAFISSQIQSAIDAVRNNPIVQAGSAIVGAVTNPIGAAQSVINAVTPKFNGHIPNAATGFIPNAASGLMGAVARESAAMPTGAQVVVANDSEWIMKPTGRSANSGSSGNTYVFNVYGGDSETVADKVIAKIQRLFEDELSTQLA